MTLTESSELYRQPALQTSVAQAWPGVRVERFQLGAMQVPAHTHVQHLLLLHQGAQPVRSRRQSGSRVEEDLFSHGDAGLYPAGDYGPLAWDGPVDIIQLHLEVDLLEARAQQDVEVTRFVLRDHFRFADGLLMQLGQQLLAATGQAHQVGRLYAESLTHALSYHLIAHHATYDRHPIGAAGRLPAVVLARIDAYIEAFVEQPITLAALAGLANLSVFHFARRFKLTTGRSPYHYVLEWKIGRARQLLRQGQLPIEAIGDALGFASPAHFSAAFKRAVGQGPRAFQRG